MGWENAILDTVCSIDKKRYNPDNLPYVGLENIEPNTGKLIDVNDTNIVKSSTFFFDQSHLLYGRLRPYLNKVALPDFEGHCSSEIFPIKCSGSLLKDFLFYWLTFSETVDKINETCTGARMPRANVKEVMTFRIPLPPLPEQRRLVHLLDTAFGEIERARVLLARNLVNAGELFESRLGEVFGDDNWNTFELGDHLHIKHGFAFKSEFFTDKSEYQLLTPGNFYESGGYKDRGIKQKYYDGEFPEAFLLNAGDLLLAMTEQAAGLLGSPLLVPIEGNYLHNQRLGLVEFTSDRKFSKRLLFYLFNTKEFRNELYRTGTGVKVRHTSPTKICAFSARFPAGFEEQERVADHLDSILKATKITKSHYTHQLHHLTELKQSLLAKAFAGEL